MKNIQQRIFVTIVLLAAISIQSNAQEFNTSESIGDQLKNNKLKGVLYAPPKQAKASRQKGFEGSSLAHELKTGTTPEMKFAKGGSTNKSVRKNSETNGKDAASLPSAKAVEKEAVKKTPINPPLPTQGEATDQTTDGSAKKAAGAEIVPVTAQQEVKTAEKKQ